MGRPVLRSAIWRATEAAPSMDWSLRVKQSTSTSGRWTVQMSAMSLRPVRLSMRT
ncbi:hypothetical protein SBADM41S_08904 [Streptomyces badius]